MNEHEYCVCIYLQINVSSTSFFELVYLFIFFHFANHRRLKVYNMACD